MVFGMLRSASGIAFVGLLAFLPSHASASGSARTGGISASMPVAAQVQPPVATNHSSGGIPFSHHVATPPPVAAFFSVAPAKVRAGSALRIAVRIDELHVHQVSVRVTFFALRGNGATIDVDSGRIATGRRVHLTWPKHAKLKQGRYRVILHATGPHNLQLARGAHASGRTTLTVTKPKPKPKPKPAPTPTTTTTTTPPPPPTLGGTFPVAGPYSFGDGFGAPRKGYTHQGQDILAALGTPVVAPLAGSIDTTGYQASSAGYYVVENAADGHAFFFAHCAHSSVAVTTGQTIVQGQELCHVGQTGDATGPHLHFEVWIDGWRLDKASHPVDPLAQLQAWAR
jgi:murein DD-endopeptidase MepM/ murein hydrolase activator NlpD